nr:MAG TPA: hypothetical protein [Caudoviricetes sp.]
MQTVLRNLRKLRRDRVLLGGRRRRKGCQWLL